MECQEIFGKISDYVDSKFKLLTYRFLFISSSHNVQPGLKTDTRKFLVIHRRVCDTNDGAIPVHTAELVIAPNGTGNYRVLGQTTEVVNIFNPMDLSFNRVALDTVLAKFDWKYRRCSGMSSEEYDESMAPYIRYEPKKMERWSQPRQEVHSSDCLKWFTAKLKTSQRCPKCVKFCNELRQTKVKQLKTPVSKKRERTDASSSFPKSLLSPPSKRKRDENVRKASISTVKQLARLREKVSKMDIELNDEQSEDMTTITEHITTHEGATLDAAIRDSGDGDEQEEMHRIWDRDLKAFRSDQAKNGELMIAMIFYKVSDGNGIPELI